MLNSASANVQPWFACSFDLLAFVFPLALACSLLNSRVSVLALVLGMFIQLAGIHICAGVGLFVVIGVFVVGTHVTIY